MSKTVTVTGVIRDASGNLYEGAVVEAYLNTPLKYDGVIYTNEVIRTYSDKYGRFYLDLVPSVYDQENENFYTFKFIRGTIVSERKIVPGNSPVIEYESLVDYIPQGLRTPLLGNLNQTDNPNPVKLPQELIGLFSWTSFTADGSTNVFTTPGEIFIVALNGIVQSSPADYVKRSPNTIEFVSTPIDKDTVSIQFRI